MTCRSMHNEIPLVDIYAGISHRDGCQGPAEKAARTKTWLARGE